MVLLAGENVVNLGAVTTTDRIGWREMSYKQKEGTHTKIYFISQCFLFEV